jgi:sugar phosphate isomerase/epimerase/cephalosporin-C deacetylase-like acetyl esterase
MLVAFGGMSLSARDVDVVAVYYPHWHRYEKGIEWFGEKWNRGEWEFVRTATPRYPGHVQPVRPLPGYLDGSDPCDVETEIALASGAGIDVFLYDYYYYGGETTQEEALESGFLKARNRGRMKFALMWCYHERRDQFRPAKELGEERRMLMELDHTPEELLGLIDLSIERYFRKPEYWRRDGKLFFSIFNGPYLVKMLGEDGVKSALSAARQKARDAGLGEMHFNAQGFGPDQAALAKSLGFDSLMDYNIAPRSSPDGMTSYESLAENSRARWAKFEGAPLPYYPVVSTGWDRSARCRLEESLPWSSHGYPYGSIVTNATPEMFESLLREAKAYAEKGRRGLVYVNAWNEYTECPGLLPTVQEGDARLRAVARVFASESEPQTGNVPYKLGVAGYSFKEMSLDKTLATMSSIDCRYLCHKDFLLPYEASDGEITDFKSRLSAAGVKCLATGPLYVKDEESLHRQFEFAKKMNLRVVVGVPYGVPDGVKDGWFAPRFESDEMLDVVERLVKEYDICYAIHNHGPDLPNLYPTADAVWARIKNRDPRIGFCLDVGHERRAGRDPCESIRKYAARIYDVHLKNICYKGLYDKAAGKIPNKAMQGPRGELDIPAILQTLADVRYTGVCHIEYERDFADNAMGLAESVGYYRGVMDMVRTDPAASEEAKPLKVLMIGNSFSLSNLREMPSIARSMGRGLDIAALYIGGCTLSRHWDNIEAASTNAEFRPYHLDRFVNGRRIAKKAQSNIQEALSMEAWDVVSVQQGSHASWDASSYSPFGERLVAEIRRLAPQAKVVVQETWSYPPWDKRLARFGFDGKEMYRRLHAAYGAFARGQGLDLIPVGTAAESCPDRNRLFTEPDFHFNNEGVYLQGLVWTAKLFGVDVEKCVYRPKKIDADRAAVLRKVAMDALRSPSAAAGSTSALSEIFANAWIKGVTDKDPVSYKAGEEMVFTLTPEGLGGDVPKGECFLEWKRTGDDGVCDHGRVPFSGDPFVYRTRIDKPGFVRLQACVVDRQGRRFKKKLVFKGDERTPEGRIARNRFERKNKTVFFDGGAGADIEKLKSHAEPADFDAFWERQYARLDRVPIRADLVEIPCGNANARLYAVRVDCAGLRPVTGYLGVPKAVDDGKTFPARLETQGYTANNCIHFAPKTAADDEIVFNINAHGLKLAEFGATDADTKALLWEIRSNGNTYAFDKAQNADPETAYFNGMFLRVKRALQYLKTLKGWNGKDLFAYGNSQGGLQTIWAAACGEGVTGATSGITWCCDIYTNGKLRKDESLHLAANSWGIEWTDALGYYDAVNFAKRIPLTCHTTIPRAGLGDYTCPPTGLAKLWNNIPGNKEIRWVQGSQHGYMPEQYEGRDSIRRTQNDSPILP